MSLQVLPPQYDASNKSFTFTFKNAPKIEDLTSDISMLHISEDDLTEVFIREFIQQASRHFSKPLELSNFYKRLGYKWITEEVEIEKVLGMGEMFRATWIPARMIFYTTRYEIHFSLAEVEAVIVPSTIPPGFLDELGVPGEEVHTTKLPELPELLPIAEIKQESIPFGEITPEEKAKREVARKHIRQARLRASLAQLKAEKLAERYYKRYGNFEVDSSESELSSQEEK